jgi:hypothetical protein
LTRCSGGGLFCCCFSCLFVLIIRVYWPLFHSVHFLPIFLSFLLTFSSIILEISYVTGYAYHPLKNLLCLVTRKPRHSTIYRWISQIYNNYIKATAKESMQNLCPTTVGKMLCLGRTLYH